MKKTFIAVSFFCILIIISTYIYNYHIKEENNTSNEENINIDAYYSELVKTNNNGIIYSIDNNTYTKVLISFVLIEIGLVLPFNFLLT